MKSNRPYITIKIKDKKTGMVVRCSSYSSGHIFNFLKANKFKDCTIEVSVRYPDGGRNRGNDYDRSYAIFALKAFLE